MQTGIKNYLAMLRICAQFYVIRKKNVEKVCNLFEVIHPFVLQKL